MRILAVTLVALGLSACATPKTGGPDPQRCDAEASKSLIGSHVGAIDFVAGANIRMVCTTCAATDDHRPDRLNIRFDEATGIVRSVDCG